jgi:hypothetical protein
MVFGWFGLDSLQRPPSLLQHPMQIRLVVSIWRLFHRWRVPGSDLTSCIYIEWYFVGCGLDSLQKLPSLLQHPMQIQLVVSIWRLFRWWGVPGLDLTSCIYIEWYFVGCKLDSLQKPPSLPHHPMQIRLVVSIWRLFRRWRMHGSDLTSCIYIEWYFVGCGLDSLQKPPSLLKHPKIKYD